MPLQHDTPVYQQLFREGKWDVPYLDPDSRRVEHNRLIRMSQLVSEGYISREEFDKLIKEQW